MIEMDKPAGLASFDGTQMSLKSVKAIGQVKGLLLEMTIRQDYKNDTDTNIETVYTFPLAWGATFMDLSIEIDGKRLSGVVTEKKVATKRYEKAITEGDLPIMLEKNSEGLYTVNVGNLKAGEDVVIEYTYCQILKYEEGTVRLTLPTTIAPRYGDSSTGGIKEHQTAESSLLVEYPLSLSISLSGGMEVATIECPSHQVQVSKKDESLHIELTREAYLDRDFILNLSKLNNQSFCIVTPDTNLGPTGCTILASFCPPIPSVKSTQPIKLKILVDCSGSMEGDSIESAKRALHHILSHLESNDQFSYSCFGSDVQHHFKKLKSINSFNLLAANLMITKTKADMGGTETGEALLSTFNLNNEESLSDVFLITDGEVWETEEIIKKAKASGHRIFAIGVGSAPAESFLQGLAEETGGACELVSPTENIEQAIVRMFNRMRLPRIQNVNINWGPGEIPLWVSGNTQSIFHGNTSHIFAGFSHVITSPPSLSFQTEDSKESTMVGFNDITHSENFNLARLGASTRLKDIKKTSDQIELAVRYQLVTEDTNFILIHNRTEEEKANDLPELQKIAQMQAAGWGGFGSVIEKASNAANSGIQFSMRVLPNKSVVSHSISNLSSFEANASAPLMSGEFYDIPAFLRKVDHAPDSFNAPPTQNINIQKNKEKKKILTQDDVIDIANFEIEKIADISEFVKVMETQNLPRDILETMIALSKNLKKEEIWVAILAWLLINHDDDSKWNVSTKQTIELLTETLDSNTLLLSFESFEQNLYYWI